MPQQTVTGAQLACSFGTSPSALTVLPVNRVQCAKVFAATIQDFVPNVNIAPFGMCISVANPAVAAATAAALGVLTPQPCLPVTTAPWTPGATGVNIAHQPALNNASTCSCQWGGVITVGSSGQTSTSIP